MPFKTINDLRYYSFSNLEDKGVTQAVFTRQGGVSEAPFDTLNLGNTVGDDRENVAANKAKVFASLDLDINYHYEVWQVHGNTVVCTNGAKPDNQYHERADAILTNQPGLTLMMRFADCVPVFLVDPVKGVIGIVHAGWIGTSKKVVEKAVETMQEIFSTNPEDIFAAIGPSIGAEHYEVDLRVVREMNASFGLDAGKVLKSKNGDDTKYYLDLWRANEIILKRSGVNNIEIAGLCTACNLDDWYSHRAEAGNTGRFGALISLSNPFE